jgi:hypothetical protein
MSRLAIASLQQVVGHAEWDRLNAGCVNKATAALARITSLEKVTWRYQNVRQRLQSNLALESPPTQKSQEQVFCTMASFVCWAMLRRIIGHAVCFSL